MDGVTRPTPYRNRVTPWGDLVAVRERGTLTGNRGVLHDETRAITRNRQPGRCCDAGCSAPGQAVMVEMPSPATDGSRAGRAGLPGAANS